MTVIFVIFEQECLSVRPVEVFIPKPRRQPNPVRKIRLLIFHRVPVSPAYPQFYSHIHIQHKRIRVSHPHPDRGMINPPVRAARDVSKDYEGFYALFAKPLIVQTGKRFVKIGVWQERLHNYTDLAEFVRD